MCGRRSQGRRVGLNETAAETLSEGVWGRVVSSASDRLGNSRQFAFGRVKGFRKSAFFPPLWQSPERLGSVCSVGFPWQIKMTPKEHRSAKRRVLAGRQERFRLCSAEHGRPAAGRAAPRQGRAAVPSRRPLSSPRWVFLLPRGPILRSGRQEGRRGAARGGQPCPPWRGPPSRCRPVHCHGNRCSCSSKFPGGSAPGAPAGTRQPPPPPRSWRERGAAPRNDPPRPQPSVGRSAAWGQLCREEPFRCLFCRGHGGKRKAGGAPELGGSKRGGTPAANTLSPPPCWGHCEERMEMRGGRTRGRQMPEQSWSLSSAASHLCPPGSFARPGHRLPHLPGLFVPAPGPADAPSAAGPAAPAGSPLPRDGAASFSGVRVKLGQFPRSSP